MHNKNVVTISTVSKQLKVLDIILSLIVNMPVIRDVGLHPSKILALVVGDGSLLPKLLLALQDVMLIITTSSTDAEVKKAFHSGNSKAVVFVLQPNAHIGKREYRIITIFWEYLQLALTDSNIRSMPLIICTGYVPAVIKDYCFEAHLSIKDISHFPTSLMRFIPDYKDFGLIYSDVKPHLDSMYPELFFAATMLCYGYYYKQFTGHDNFIADTYTLVDSLIDIDSQYKESSIDKCHVFIHFLEKWLEDNNDKVIILPYISASDEQDMKSMIFVDESFIYLDYSLYARIIDQSETHIKSGVMSESLKSEKIIISGTDAITSRMTYQNESGTIKEKRMLKLSKESLKNHGMGGEFYA